MPFRYIFIHTEVQCVRLRHAVRRHTRITNNDDRHNNNINKIPSASADCRGVHTISIYSKQIRMFGDRLYAAHRCRNASSLFRGAPLLLLATEITIATGIVLVRWNIKYDYKCNEGVLKMHKYETLRLYAVICAVTISGFTNLCKQHVSRSPSLFFSF